MSEFDPALGPPPSDEEIEKARQKLIEVRLSQVNKMLYVVLQKTDYVHFSEFLEDGKKQNLKKERKSLKEKSEALEEEIKSMDFKTLVAFSVEERFKQEGWI